jgi:hypothetical protein
MLILTISSRKGWSGKYSSSRTLMASLDGSTVKVGVSFCCFFLLISTEGGSLLSHHSSFYFNPTAGYGVIALMTGKSKDSFGMAFEAIEIFQPFIDRYISSIASTLYDGTFQSNDGRSQVSTYVKNGGLWISELILDGEDILGKLVPMNTKSGTLPHGRSYGVWWAGREEEFRYVCGNFARNHTEDLSKTCLRSTCHRWTATRTLCSYLGDNGYFLRKWCSHRSLPVRRLGCDTR